MTFDSVSQDVTIALLVPTTTNKLEIKTVHDLPLVKYLLTSLKNTIECDINYTLYLGYDSDDKYYSRMSSDDLDYINNLLPKVTIIWEKYEDTKGNPCAVWNRLFDRAYHDGCDYFYQLGDDITFSAKGWSSALVGSLRESSVCSGFGVTGLVDVDMQRIITQSFVSRIHYQIFNYYYPPVFKNWYSDDWITQVYASTFCKQMVNYQIKNGIRGYLKEEKNSTVNSIERYSIDKSVEQIFPQIVRDGQEQIQKWLKGHPNPHSLHLNHHHHRHPKSLPILCFHLDKYTDRKEHVIKQAHNFELNIDFIKAFDGWKLPKAEKFTCCRAHPERITDYMCPHMEYNHLTVNNQFYLFNSNLTKGEVGLAITTIDTFQRLLSQQDGPEWVMVIEDDIDFCHDFVKHYNQIQDDLAELSAQKVDFVYLNDAIKPHMERNDLNIINDRYLPVFKGCGYYGYLISKSGMQKLLQIFNPLTFPIDIQSIAHCESFKEYSKHRYRELNRLRPDFSIRGYKYHIDLITHSTTFKSTIHGFCPYHC